MLALLFQESVIGHQFGLVFRSVEVMTGDAQYGHLQNHGLSYGHSVPGFPVPLQDIFPFSMFRKVSALQPVMWGLYFPVIVLSSLS